MAVGGTIQREERNQKEKGRGGKKDCNAITLETKAGGLSVSSKPA